MTVLLCRILGHLLFEMLRSHCHSKIQLFGEILQMLFQDKKIPQCLQPMKEAHSGLTYIVLKSESLGQYHLSPTKKPSYLQYITIITPSISIFH